MSAGVCIVCDGWLQTADGAPCWCCVERLPGPRPSTPLTTPPTAEGEHPDLHAWIRRFGGYDRIDWSAWNAAVERARKAPPVVLNPGACAYCGERYDVPGDRLLPLITVGVNAIAMVHVTCWTPFIDAQRGEDASDQREDDSEPDRHDDDPGPKKFWSVCSVCGLQGPVDAPGKIYCLRHRPEPGP
jgi:hypothetical protein